MIFVFLCLTSHHMIIPNSIHIPTNGIISFFNGWVIFHCEDPPPLLRYTPFSHYLLCPGFNMGSLFHFIQLSGSLTFFHGFTTTSGMISQVDKWIHCWILPRYSPYLDRGIRLGGQSVLAGSYTVGPCNVLFCIFITYPQKTKIKHEIPLL